MKLWIPDISDRFRLLAPWTFRLFNESRNMALMELSNKIMKEGKAWSWRAHAVGHITIPTGSVLKVSRVYIRNGAREFSSLTFWLDEVSGMLLFDPIDDYEDFFYETEELVVPKGKGKAKRKSKPRFWAKLADVNLIECEPLPREEK